MLSAAASRLKLLDPDPARLRKSLMAEHMLKRVSMPGRDDADASRAVETRQAATGAEVRRRTGAKPSDQEILPVTPDMPIHPVDSLSGDESHSDSGDAGREPGAPPDYVDLGAMILDEEEVPVATRIIEDEEDTEPGEGVRVGPVAIQSPADPGPGFRRLAVAPGYGNGIPRHGPGAAGHRRISAGRQARSREHGGVRDARPVFSGCRPARSRGEYTGKGAGAATSERGRVPGNLLLYGTRAGGLRQPRRQPSTSTERRLPSISTFRM